MKSAARIPLCAIVAFVALPIWGGAQSATRSSPKPAQTAPKANTSQGSSPATNQGAAPGARCGYFGDGLGYQCYPAASSNSTASPVPSYQSPGINWNSLSSTRISQSDVQQACQNAMSRAQGQVSATAFTSMQGTCNLAVKCLPQCSGLGNNGAVNTCMQNCLGLNAPGMGNALTPNDKRTTADDFVTAISGIASIGTGNSALPAPLIDSQSFAKAGTDPVDQAVQDLLNDNGVAPPPPPPSPLNTVVQNARDYISDTASDAVSSMKQGIVNFYNWVSNGFSFEAMPAAENDSAPSVWQQFNGGSDNSESTVQPVFETAHSAIENLDGNEASKKTTGVLLPIYQGAVDNETHLLDQTNDALQNGGPPPQFNSVNDIIDLRKGFPQVQAVTNSVQTTWQSVKSAVTNFFTTKPDPNDLFSTSHP